MNSLRSAWTPVLAGSKPTYRQAKEKSEAYTDELYSLSDWYKISVRSITQLSKSGYVRSHRRDALILPPTRALRFVDGVLLQFRTTASAGLRPAVERRSLITDGRIFRSADHFHCLVYAAGLLARAALAAYPASRRSLEASARFRFALWPPGVALRAADVWSPSKLPSFAFPVPGNERQLSNSKAPLQADEG